MADKTVIQSFFSWFYDLFFKKVGHNMPVGSIKKIMDPFFVITEKIVCHFPVFTSLYLEPYRSMIAQELSMQSLSSKDTVLIIGCGSLPATALALAEQCDAKIDCVDIDIEAVQNAKEVVSSLKNMDNISIHHKNGLDHPMDTYDIIFILYGIKEQIKILEYISSSMNKNAKILFRSSTDLKLTKPKVYQKMISFFSVEDQVKIDSFGSIETYLLRLKK
jgi:hypothetical protein